MLAPAEALSKNFFEGDTSHVIPYDEGDFERYPKPAGSIHLESCRQTYKGALFTFKLDVFTTAWRPLYSIEITPLYGNQIDVIDCPAGWIAEVYPQAYDKAPGRVSFYTESNPIMPGSELSGFTVLSHSDRAVVRWYGTGKEGIMLGGVTRTVFVCHTGTVADTWGSIKSMYR
jgi:hypothetical protein